MLAHMLRCMAMVRLPHLLMQLRLGRNGFLLIWALCILLNGGPLQSVMQRLGRNLIPLPLLCTNDRRALHDSRVMPCRQQGLLASGHELQKPNKEVHHPPPRS